MNGKVVIGAIVCGLIVFIVQSLSWMVLGIHTNDIQHTDAEYEIIDMLEKNMQEGTYVVPMPKSDSEEDRTAYAEERAGKPWAMISYHKSYDANMMRPMIVGLLLNILSALLVAMLLWGVREHCNTMKERMMLILSFPIFVILFQYLMDWNWWSRPMSLIWPQIIDALLAWILGGLWLSWWLFRGNNKVEAV